MPQQLVINLPPDIPPPKFSWGQQVQIERHRSTIKGKVTGLEWWTLQAAAAYDRDIESAGWHYTIEIQAKADPHLFAHEDDMEAIEVQYANQN